jgi:hypothetical protein
VPGRVELRGFEPLPSCMPSQRTLQIGHHCTMPDLTRPQVRNAAPCGLVRRHAASCREIDGERPSSHPCHTCATTTEPYSQPGSSLAGRSNPPGATPACAPTEPSERGGRSSGCLSGTTTTTPIVGVSPAAPTPLPASLPCALPSRPGAEPSSSCPRASKVGRTATVAAPPNRVKRRRGFLTLGGTP